MTHKVIGNYGLFLHAHLPYVLHHGRWPQGSEWLCEAASETYLPLLGILDELIQEGYHPKITLDISPILAEQLSSKSFHRELQGYLDARIQIAQNNQRTFIKEKNEQFCYLAQLWEEFYRHLKTQFAGVFNCDLIAAFRKLQEGGYLEIITCAATHGYLPLFKCGTSIQRQLKIAIKTHLRHFQRPPAGIWLPECGYLSGSFEAPPVTDSKNFRYFRKGLEEFLGENQIKYFIYHTAGTDDFNYHATYTSDFSSIKSAHLHSEVREKIKFSPYQPYQVLTADFRDSGVAAFPRDSATSLQVWSGTTGYPGDEWFLEFHRKHQDGGLRYWRITGRNFSLENKQSYEPEQAARRYEDQANHFRELIKSKLHLFYQQTGRPGFLLTPFDAELFGHWWFEGPKFLKNLLKGVEQDPDIQLQTCSENLAAATIRPSTILEEGSWGEGGMHKTWLNENTTWLWEKLYAAEDRLQSFLIRIEHKQNSQFQDILKQAIRELLLLQSSDWPFLISTGTGTDYAKRRFSGHLAAFHRILDLADKYLQNGKLAYHEWLILHHYQIKDSIFSDIELDWINNKS